MLSRQHKYPWGAMPTTKIKQVKSMTIDMTDKFYTFEFEYPITMAEHDLYYRLKPAALLNLLQDCASRHIDLSPFNNHDLNAQNLGWFLIRYRIEFDKYPQELSCVKIKTEHRGFLRQTSFRDFEAYDNNGERLLRATTSWLMVDLSSKSLVNLEQKYPDIKKFEKRGDDLVLRRLKSCEDFDNQTTFRVRYDDLDMNGHVNNIVYMTWALEALDFDFRNSHTIGAINIYYRHEAKYGEKILSCVKHDDKFSMHLIKNAANDEEICLIKIEYK